jgi:hypothetical protein
VVAFLPSCLSSIRNIQALTANRRTINEPSIILRYKKFPYNWHVQQRNMDFKVMKEQACT